MTILNQSVSEDMQKLMERSWQTTPDIGKAMKFGCIGETLMVPTRLSQHIKHALRRPLSPRGTVFYIGKPDAHLADKFGLQLDQEASK